MYIDYLYLYGLRYRYNDHSVLFKYITITLVSSLNRAGGKSMGGAATKGNISTRFTISYNIWLNDISVVYSKLPYMLILLLSPPAKS